MPNLTTTIYDVDVEIEVSEFMGQCTTSETREVLEYIDLHDVMNHVVDAEAVDIAANIDADGAERLLEAISGKFPEMVADRNDRTLPQSQHEAIHKALRILFGLAQAIDGQGFRDTACELENLYHSHRPVAADQINLI